VTSLQDVRQQLDRFGEQLQGTNPDLYRDLALYLQVLRDGLLNSVQQACFHLATRFYPDRYCGLEAEQRQSLHAELQELVRRASSLLTVEQVAQLAGQGARERQLRRRQRQQEWLAQLRKVSEEEDGSPPSEPDGSIHLQGGLPISLPHWPVMPSLHLESAGEGHADGEPGPIRESPFSGDAPIGADPAETPQADSLLDENGDSLLDAFFEEAPGSTLPPPWNEAGLPRDPVGLLVWLDGFEQALARRLRNLSHATNVELLRAGLCPSLLPLSLLQAALEGQLEPLPAPANLLRLQVPLAPEAGGQLESVAVLLRLADLELEQPRLRTCRSRWQRHRQEVRRMAEQHRRLQRRLQMLEAERLWHQDIPSLPLSDTPP